MSAGKGRGIDYSYQMINVKSIGGKKSKQTNKQTKQTKQKHLFVIDHSTFASASRERQIYRRCTATKLKLQITSNDSNLSFRLNFSSYSLRRERK